MKPQEFILMRKTTIKAIEKFSEVKSLIRQKSLHLKRQSTFKTESEEEDFFEQMLNADDEYIPEDYERSEINFDELLLERRFSKQSRRSLNPYIKHR